MLERDALRDRESEPGAAGLCRGVGLEEAGGDLGRDARAVVGHGERDIVAVGVGRDAHRAARDTLNRLERILEKRELRVCIWPDYYSITYRNPKTLQLSGIDIDMANEFGKELGVH